MSSRVKWSECAAGQVISTSPVPPAPRPGLPQPTRFFVFLALGGWSRVLLPPPEGCGCRGIQTHQLDLNVSGSASAAPAHWWPATGEHFSPAHCLAQGPTSICPYVDRKLIFIKSSQKSGSIQCQQQMESVSDPSEVNLDKLAW